MLQYGYLIEGIGIADERCVIAGHLQHAVALYLEPSFVYIVYCVLYAFGRETCEKAQSASVDTDDRNAFVSHFACCVEKCAITADAYDIVGRKVLVAEHFTCRNVYVWYGCQKLIKWLVYCDVCVSFFCYVEEALHGRAFVFLVYIAKKSELYVFCHIYSDKFVSCVKKLYFCN